MPLRAALSLLACAAALACGGSPPRPNVVLIVLDTTRADRFSSYGYEAAETPHFDAFAADGVRFENAFSTSSWTVPSHASLFTGKYPMTHGATQETQRLADEHDTLAELLAGEGYETVAFSNNAWVGSRANLTQGFERDIEAWRQRGVGQARRTNRGIEHWLDIREEGPPFFLFVNYIEPHWPYSAPRKAQERLIGQEVSRDRREAANFGIVSWYLEREGIDPDLLPLRDQLYDAEVSVVDEAVGALLALLQERGLYEDSLIVVSADHGESLGDNGHQGHSFVLYDATLRVPLVVRWPGGDDGGATRSDPVQLTDVFATIAAATGLRERGVGRDLADGPLPSDRPVVGEYYYPAQIIEYFPEESHSRPPLSAFLRRIRSLRVGPHKLIWGSDGRHELYDVAADPGETRDLIAQEPEIAARLQERLAAIVAEHAVELAESDARAVELDPEVEESLRELGYVR